MSAARVRGAPPPGVHWRRWEHLVWLGALAAAEVPAPAAGAPPEQQVAAALAALWDDLVPARCAACGHEAHEHGEQGCRWGGDGRVDCVCTHPPTPTASPVSVDTPPPAGIPFMG